MTVQAEVKFSEIAGRRATVTWRVGQAMVHVSFAAPLDPQATNAEERAGALLKAKHALEKLIEQMG